MKRLLLIPILLWAGCSFGQIVDQFDYATALDANGWLSQGGTAGQITPVTMIPGDVGNNLSYSGLATSVGNRTALVAGNNQDINKGIAGITGTGYYSFLLKVTNTTNLITAAGGEYFIGFGNSNATNLTVYGGRVYIRAGATPNTFQLGVMNTTGGTPAPAPTFHTTEYPVGTTVFVAVKLDLTTSPYTVSLFVNPVPGAAEPTATVTNNAGTSTTSFTTFASIFLRQAGSGTSTTGNLEIDEIRAGSTWASVTPTGVTPPCTNTTATIDTASCAASYTVPSGDEFYTVAGTYNDTIPNAEGCDSILTINLTFVSSFNYYPDLDGDGLGDNSATAVVDCDPVANHVTNNNDCDDTDPLIGAGTAYYPDLDGDGLGDNSATAVVDCDPVANHVANNDDCNDADDQIGAATLYYVDADNDGYGSASDAGTPSCILVPGSVINNDDCNDNDDAIYPGATEIPNNGIDEDCDGSDLNTIGATLGMYQFQTNTCPLVTAALDVTTQPTNATFSAYGVTGPLNCQAAADVFNFAGFNTTSTVDLTQYFNFSVTPASCYGMDLNRIIFTHKTSGTGGTPIVHLRSSLDNFATDIATKQLPNSNYKTDTIDLGAAFDNVTSAIEFRWYITEIGSATATYRHDNVTVIGNINALPTQTYYADADGDTYGNPAVTQTACTAPAGYVSDNTDCDDTDAEEFPGAVWYADTDGDGLGNAQSSQVSCTRPANHVSDSTDCNDTDDQIGAEILYYVDADGDTYGDADDMGTLSCIPVTGSVTNNEDCDDSDDAINPDATEVCDGVDNNCDGNTDEGFTMTTYYEDADGDTYGDPASSVSDCAQPAGYVTNDDDCDDNNAAAHPGATDNTGNGVDENCDGVDGVLGIEESILAQLNVYPNPGTSSVVLDLASGWNGFKVAFIGVDGKEIAVMATQKSVTELEFNTNTLVPGTYFIRLTSASGTALVRWVKN